MNSFGWKEMIEFHDSQNWDLTPESLLLLLPVVGS